MQMENESLWWTSAFDASPVERLRYALEFQEHFNHFDCISRLYGVPPYPYLYPYSTYTGVT